MKLTFAPLKQKAEVAQLVEHNLAKVGVVGSSPIFRSKSYNLSFFMGGFFSGSF